MNKRSGIYKIVNLANGKLYVGSATNLLARKATHFKHLRENKSHSSKLQNAWNKYGEINFIFEVIEFVDDKSKLIEREQYWLDTLDAVVNGYNFKLICDSPLGTKLAQSTKDKIRTSHIGKILSDEHKMNISLASKGRKLSEATKAKMRIAQANHPFYKGMTGRKHSQETKDKIALALLNNKNRVKT